MAAATHHPACLQPADDGMRVWRYLTFAKLMSTLQTGSLFFVRTDRLGDPYEGSLSAPMWERLQREAPDPLQWARLRDRFLPLTHVNCWHGGEHESEAMWRIYATNDSGVAIRSTYSTLRESISYLEMHIGLVQYSDYQREEFEVRNFWHAVMHKRKAYEYEREVRLITALHPTRVTQQIVDAGGISIPWDWLSAIDAIVVSPYAAGWLYETIRCAVANVSPLLTARVQWSSLRAPPRF
jgi:hypothetical protein